MVRGPFRFFQHDHVFSEKGGTTEMKDVLRFAAPLGFLGSIAELPLKPYLRQFLRKRNTLLKQVAEGDEWLGFFER